jgi:hypothetical protein
MKNNPVLEKCSNCDNMDSPDHFGNCEEAKVMREKHVCFSCAFWMIKIELVSRYPEKYVIDRGVLCYINNQIAADFEAPGEWGRGHGGRKVKVTRGETTIYTNDLWCNGNIPAWAINQFPPSIVGILTWM